MLTQVEIDGIIPPLIIPPRLPAGWRWLWPGEVVPPGAEMFDWRDNTFVPVQKAVGSIMPKDPLHNSLSWIPVRVPACFGLLP